MMEPRNQRRQTVVDGVKRRVPGRGRAVVPPRKLNDAAAAAEEKGRRSMARARARARKDRTSQGNWVQYT